MENAFLHLDNEEKNVISVANGGNAIRRAAWPGAFLNYCLQSAGEKRGLGGDTRVSIDAALLMHALAQMITALATGHDCRARTVLCMFN